jgi:thiamine-phosphate pyrophosphorylase
VDIYPVTAEKLSAGRSNLEVLDQVIAGGAKIVQLREKDIPAGELYELALAFRRKTEEAKVLLIINDHVDIALAVEADGVHLGQDDLPVDAARRIAPDLLIGASTHSLEQALRAERLGADYINIGPVFPTETKEGHTKFLGPEGIREIGSRTSLPFTVMGGIKWENLEPVLDAGARRVAMVTGITQAEDIGGTVKAFGQRIRDYRRP